MSRSNGTFITLLNLPFRQMLDHVITLLRGQAPKMLHMIAAGKAASIPERCRGEELATRRRSVKGFAVTLDTTRPGHQLHRVCEEAPSLVRQLLGAAVRRAVQPSRPGGRQSPGYFHGTGAAWMPGVFTRGNAGNRPTRPCEACGGLLPRPRNLQKTLLSTAGRWPCPAPTLPAGLGSEGRSSHQKGIQESRAPSARRSTPE